MKYLFYITLYLKVKFNVQFIKFEFCRAVRDWTEKLETLAPYWKFAAKRQYCDEIRGSSSVPVQ